MYRVWHIDRRERIAFDELVSLLVSADIVFFGEVHESPGVLEAELDVLVAAVEKCPCLTVFMEMFNYEQQHLLESYLSSRITWQDLLREYSKSREGFNLNHYRYLIEYASQRGLRVVGVMPPRERASLIARHGLGAVSGDRVVKPSEIDYDIPCYRERFLAMIPRSGPMAKLDPSLLLQAQAYKDETVARIIAANISPKCTCKPRGIVYMGYGHVEHVGTVPQRLVRLTATDYIVITSRIRGYGSESRVVEELARDYCRLAKILVTSPLENERK